MCPAQWRGNQVRTCLGQKDSKDNHEGSSQDREKPKDSLPPQKFCKHTSNDGADCRPQQAARKCGAHIFASFGGGRDVSHNSTAHCDRSAAACTLNASQHEKCSVTVLQGKANVGNNINGKANCQVVSQGSISWGLKRSTCQHMQDVFLQYQRNLQRNLEQGPEISGRVSWSVWGQ